MTLRIRPVPKPEHKTPLARALEQKRRETTEALRRELTETQREANDAA